MIYQIKFLLALALALAATNGFAEEDLPLALKRAKYLLIGEVPTNQDFSNYSFSVSDFRSGVRRFVDDDKFYNAVLRYHERLFGVGLPTEYLDELLRDDIDDRTNKFAKINCRKENLGDTTRFNCYWASENDDAKVSSCPKSWLTPASVFWYPGLVAWVCPSIIKTCGSDLSKCFVQYYDENEAKNAELGSTEIFDSRFSVVKSLAKQAAGLASAVVIENYPYTNILKSGLTAVDGAIAHFYRQVHHFDLNKLNLSDEFLDVIKDISLTDTRFKLINMPESYEQAGILSTFGWLRRYEKNRTRANQLYERLLCQKFVSELPRVFPADPGNLRTTPGCSGCHATLDPLADFFNAWGEGGELYTGRKDAIDTQFNGQEGTYLHDLALIIRQDDAFASCTVENVFEWLMGREFYREEADLRRAFTNYFIQVNYSFKELVYAVATHPAFMEGARSDATVSDPLESPPLGEPPGGVEDLVCDTDISFAADIEPNLGICTNCHNGSSARQDLTSYDNWVDWAGQSINMMTSGNMPPGQDGPPRIGAVYDLKEAVRCWVDQGKLDN